MSKSHDYPSSRLSLSQRSVRLLWYWGPVVAYAFLIFFLSAQSTPSRYIPGFFYGLSDKALHAIEYGLLAILLYRAFKHTVNTGWTIGLSIFSAMAYGVSDELHQWFVPHREADIFDLVADGFGATLLVLAWVFVTEKIQLRNTPVPASPDSPQTP